MPAIEQDPLVNTVVQAMDDLKAQNIQSIDVSDLSDVMDFFVIATGTSSRHVKALANNVIDESKRSGSRPVGVEGMDSGEWVLVDYGDVVVHVMQEATRAFYELEKLWSMEPSTRSAIQTRE